MYICKYPIPQNSQIYTIRFLTMFDNTMGSGL